MSEDIFKDYKLYIKENGKVVGVNENAFHLADEAFELFKELYDTSFGSIHEDDNLVSIHTGGWSENEALIEQLQQTFFWFQYHVITARGGHYYFNTDTSGDKEWEISIKSTSN